jgi:hypothetical protein
MPAGHPRYQSNDQHQLIDLNSDAEYVNRHWLRKRGTLRASGCRLLVEPLR